MFFEIGSAKRRLITWLRSIYSRAQVRDELTFWGAYGAMAGLQGYKKEDGSWELGLYPISRKEI